MKLRRAGICFVTGLLFISIIVFKIWVFQGKIQFSFDLENGNRSEEISCWQRNETEYVLFLPSYAKLSQLKIRTNRPIWLDDRKMTHGSSCENMQLNKSYAISDGTDTSGSITFLQSGNMPTMYIDTASGNMDYIHEAKGNKEAGGMRLYTATGELNYSGGMEFIKTRGNNIENLISSNFLKMPYSIQLMKEADLLEMGGAKKWILLSNPFDMSNLRNKIVYDFAEKVGLAYSPECRWMDLYLNGEYAGLYLLCERNEIHPERVNISEEGSFLVSQELEFRLEQQELPYICTEWGNTLRIQNSTLEQTELERIWKCVEKAIWADDSIDPETGKHLTELIDLDSWVKKYLIEEVFGNLDGGRVSQFFYMDGNDSERKVYAGPVWDYDMTMGNPTIANKMAPNMFFVNVPTDQWGSPWFHELYQNELFNQKITETFERDFLPQLEKLLDEGIAQYVDEISAAAQMNQVRWSSADFYEQAELIRCYMTERLAFLKEIWLEETTYSIVSADRMGRILNYAVFQGESLPELPYEEDCIWYDADTDLPFDLAEPIFEDRNLYLKAMWEQ